MARSNCNLEWSTRLVCCNVVGARVFARTCLLCLGACLFLNVASYVFSALDQKWMLSITIHFGPVHLTLVQFLS